MHLLLKDYGPRPGEVFLFLYDYSPTFMLGFFIHVFTGICDG